MATVQNANFIQYGRRAGRNRSAPVKKGSQMSSISEQNAAIGPMMTAQGTDLRQVKVIPRQEWERIQSDLHAKEREREAYRRARLAREQLQAESKEVVANWSNTIAGQRQKKLQARKLREEKEEANRVKMDIEEAQFQAAKRRAAIEKAKTAQYFQTDRIKSFHGALLLTEVLKERDAQIELKKQKSAAENGKDYELLKHYRNEYERGIIEDQQNAHERFRERKQIADFQQSQVQEHNVQKEKEKVDDKKEGEDIQKLVKLHEWEQQKLAELKRAEKVNIMKSHKDHVLNKEAILALERQQEEEEDNEIRLFAAAKKRMLKLRKEKEAELFKEVQDHKERMTNMLAAQLKKKVSDEGDRIQKAIKEQDEKIQKEMEMKREKLQKDLAGIAAHRNEQAKLREIKEKEEKAEAFKLLEMKLEADRLFAAKQEQRRRNMMENNQNLQDFHRAQLNERAEKERNVREEELYHDEKLVDLLAVEEEQFQQYADKVINEAKEKDRNLYPLIKAAQAGVGGGRGPAYVGKGGIRPSYLTADGYGVELHSKQRSTTESIKSKCEPGNAAVAKKRLGFVW